MTTRSFQAMGTTVELIADSEGAARAERLFEDYEQTFSRFRETSELNLVNARSGCWQLISPLFAHAVESALLAYQASDRMVTPLLGRALLALG